MTKLRLTEIPKRERNIGVVIGRRPRIGLGEMEERHKNIKNNPWLSHRDGRKEVIESNSPEGEGRRRNLAV